MQVGLTTFHVKRILPEIQNEKPTYHDLQLVSQSGRNFKQNSFIQYLKTIFNEDQVKRIILRYLIGTSSHWSGATVFWQVDSSNLVRAGKIMLYSSETGKRIKKPYPHITWVHSVLLKMKKITNFNLDQCLFGLHLINEDQDKPVAIVESEKTACIMSALFDKYLWLACGSLSNINAKMFQPIKNRKIVLYPDLSTNQKAFINWQTKSDSLQNMGFDITVSHLLEEKSTVQQKVHGLDIADFFIENQKSTNKPNSSVYSQLKAKNSCMDKLIETFNLIIPVD